VSFSASERTSLLTTEARGNFGLLRSVHTCIRHLSTFFWRGSKKHKFRKLILFPSSCEIMTHTVFGALQKTHSGDDDSPLRSMHRVNMGTATDFSEVYTASIFSFEAFRTNTETYVKSVS
jgi:hypothetical protein